jgi:hypothetical protein
MREHVFDKAQSEFIEEHSKKYFQHSRRLQLIHEAFKRKFPDKSVTTKQISDHEYNLKKKKKRKVDRDAKQRDTTTSALVLLKNSSSQQGPSVIHAQQENQAPDQAVLEQTKLEKDLEEAKSEVQIALDECAKLKKDLQESEQALAVEKAQRVNQANEALLEHTKLEKDFEEAKAQAQNALDECAKLKKDLQESEQALTVEKAQRVNQANEALLERTKLEKDFEEAKAQAQNASDRCDKNVSELLAKEIRAADTNRAELELIQAELEDVRSENQRWGTYAEELKDEKYEIESELRQKQDYASVLQADIWKQQEELSILKNKLSGTEEKLRYYQNTWDQTLKMQNWELLSEIRRLQDKLSDFQFREKEWLYRKKILEDDAEDGKFLDCITYLDELASHVAQKFDRANQSWSMAFNMKIMWPYIHASRQLQKKSSSPPVNQEQTRYQEEVTWMKDVKKLNAFRTKGTMKFKEIEVHD